MTHNYCRRAIFMRLRRATGYMYIRLTRNYGICWAFIWYCIQGQSMVSL